jgi:hypothetical protein
VLLAFAAIGRINHGEPLAGALGTALPFLVGARRGGAGPLPPPLPSLAGARRSARPPPPWPRPSPSAHGPAPPPRAPGWFAAAPLLGGYGKEARGGAVGPAAVAAAKVWALGAPLGLVVRGVSKGYVPPTPFIVVSLAATAVLMVGWRAALAAATPEVRERGGVFKGQWLDRARVEGLRAPPPRPCGGGRRSRPAAALSLGPAPPPPSAPQAAPQSKLQAAKSRQNKKGNPLEFISLLMSLTKRW